MVAFVLFIISTFAWLVVGILNYADVKMHEDADPNFPLVTQWMMWFCLLINLINCVVQQAIYL